MYFLREFASRDRQEKPRRRCSLSSAVAEEMSRRTGLNFCDGTHDLLSHASWKAAWVIPETTEDFVWPAGNPSIGCNALCCDRCGARLRNMPDFRLAYGSGADACARRFELADWSGAAAAGLAVPSEGSRSYVCRCTGIDLSFVRPLRAGSGGSLPTRIPRHQAGIVLATLGWRWLRCSMVCRWSVRPASGPT